MCFVENYEMRKVKGLAHEEIKEEVVVVGHDNTATGRKEAGVVVGADLIEGLIVGNIAGHYGSSCRGGENLLAGFELVKCFLGNLISIGAASTDLVNEDTVGSSELAGTRVLLA